MNFMRENHSMNFMKEERRIFENLYPGFAEEVLEIPLEDREGPNSDVVERFRRVNGTTLLVPREYGGTGATATEAVAVHQMLGSICPSLSVAATMHNFTVAFLAEYSFYGDATREFLRDIGENKRYLASGFAEGRAGANILHTTMEAKWLDNGGVSITGSKKPCSVAVSMDYLTASVMLEAKGSMPSQRAIAIIPAHLDGFERKEFWTPRSLAGAQTMEVVLNGVEIGEEMLFLPQADVPLDAVEAGGFLWFELLCTASYLGAVSRLYETALEQERGSAAERSRILCMLETCAAALRGMAEQIQNSPADERVSDDLVARALSIRFGIQMQLGEMAYTCAEMLGGMHFIRNPEVEYRLACCSALAFHPPSRIWAAEVLDAYARGGALEMV